MTPAAGAGDPRTPPEADQRRSRGRRGEALAARWYEGHGFRVVERNWRRREGEVDLIVRQGDTVVFCEVKVRSSDRFGTGAEAVPVAKQRRIRRLAALWLAERRPGRAPSAAADHGDSASGRAHVELRFDVVSITGGRVEVIEGAF